MGLSKISWTDYTFNSWWGCQRVSPGCEHCYAETFSNRLKFNVWGPTTERRFFDEKHWNEPLKWNKKAQKEGVRRKVFCASMADHLEDRRDLDAPRAKLYEELIPATPWLDWLLLTKRPQNAFKLMPSRWFVEGCWPRNAWFGFTAENQEQLEKRFTDVQVLHDLPAIVFVSAEPLLGPLVFGARLQRINWVIVGGESGHGAREFNISWARDIQAEIADFMMFAGNPDFKSPSFFMKQMGSLVVNGFEPRHVGLPDWPRGKIQFDARAIVQGLSGKGDVVSEWPKDLQVQEFPR